MRSRPLWTISSSSLEFSSAWKRFCRTKSKKKPLSWFLPESHAARGRHSSRRPHDLNVINSPFTGSLKPLFSCQSEWWKRSRPAAVHRVHLAVLCAPPSCFGSTTHLRFTLRRFYQPEKMAEPCLIAPKDSHWRKIVPPPHTHTHPFMCSKESPGVSLCAPHVPICW